MVLKYVNNHGSKKRDQVQILKTWKIRSFFKSFFFSKHREIICSHCCPEKKAGLQQQEQKKEQLRCKSNSLEPTNAFKWAPLTSEASLGFYIFYSFGKNINIFGLYWYTTGLPCFKTEETAACLLEMKEKNHENNKSDLLLGKYPLQETFTTNMISNGSARSISIAEGHQLVFCIKTAS